MALNIRVSKFTPINGLEHIATSYVISTDQLGTNVVNTLIKSSVYVNIYPAPINPIVGDVYWVKFKRHYKDTVTDVESEGDWTIPKMFVPTINTSELILYNEVIIEKPLVIIDKNKLDSSSSTLKFTTTEFRCSQDSHLSTHWIITDIFGTTLYVDLDSVNLTTLEISKTLIDFESKTAIIVYAIHRSASGIESEAGKSNLNIDNSNFEIMSSLQRVVPYSTYNVKLRKINSNIPLKTVKYELLRVDSDEAMIQKDLEENVTSFVIQGELLESGSKYYLDIYTVGSDSRLIRKRKILETLSISKPYIIDTDYKYKKELTFVKSVPIQSSVTNNFTVYENNKGEIPMVKINDNKVYKAKWNRDTELVEIDQLRYYPTISLVTGDNDEVFIKVLDKSIILIDSYISGVPTFSVYRYNAYNDTVSLLHTNTRSTETKCLGRNNAQVINDGILYYFPYGSNKLMKYDYTNNVLEEELVFTNSPIGVNYSLIEINANRLLIIGGDLTTTTTYSYNLDTKVILESFVLPEHFRNKETKSINLINGDALIFVTDPLGTNSEMMYYDYFNNVIEPLVLTPMGNVFPDSIIALATGEILLLANNSTETSYYKLA